MVLFLVSSAVLTLICLLFLAPALLNRRILSTADLQQENLSIAKQRIAEFSGDNPSAEEARLELEAALIDDLEGPDYSIKSDKPAGRFAAIVILGLIPVAAGLLYVQLGNHHWNKQIAVPTVEEIQENPARGIELLLARLEQVLVEQPDDAAGWELAARTYMGTQQFAKAERAYARVHELSGEHPDTLTAWADASLMVNDNVFSEEIASRVSRALELDSEHVSALWLAAMGARTNGNSEIALEYLKRLLPLVEGNAEATAETRAVIASLGGELTTTAPGPAADPPAVNSRQVSVKLSLAPEIASMATSEDIVFVFATEKNGAPAPLAVVRLRVKDLPASVLLDQTKAMIPGRTVDVPETIEITARIALDGKPTRSPGDLESQPFALTERGKSEVTLTIDTVVEAQ